MTPSSRNDPTVVLENDPWPIPYNAVAMPERSDDWIKQARRDLDASRAAAEDGFFEWACFIGHQAAEKPVKAVYQKLSAEPGDIR